MKTIWYTRTTEKNEVIFKDRRYVNFTVGSNEIEADKTTGEVVVNGELFAEDKNLASDVYNFAGYNGGYNNMTDKFAKFCLYVGYMKK